MCESDRLKLIARVKLGLVYAMMAIVTVLVAFPYFYMLSMALMTSQESVAMPAKLLPSIPQWGNFQVAWTRIHGFRPYLNTFIVAGGVTLLQLFTSSLAGFGFAKYNFKGRDLVFFLLLGSMTIPLFINIIPWYWMISQVHLTNTLLAVMLPHFVTAFGVFMMRQFMLDLPDELFDAARIDGASEFTIYRRIALPLCGPAMATLAAFAFLYHWNDLLWPLIVLSDRANWTINLAVASLQGYMGVDRQMQITGGAMSVIPVVILVILLQRYFVQGTMMSGIKG